MPTQTPAGPASKVLLPSVRARGAAHVWRLHPPGFPRGNLPRAAMRDPRLLHWSPDETSRDSQRRRLARQDLRGCGHQIGHQM